MVSLRKKPKDIRGVVSHVVSEYLQCCLRVVVGRLV